MRVFLYAFAVLVSVCCGAEARVLTALPKGADIDGPLQEWVRRAFPDATLGRRTGDNVLVITRDGRFLSVTVLDDTRDITTPDETEASLTQAPFSCRDIRRTADHTTDRIRMATFSADCPTFGPVFLGVFYDGVRMQGMMIAAGLGQPRELVERAQAIFDGAGPGFAVSEDSEAVPRPFQWPTIAEALADDYSSKMVDEFLAILRESADRGCLAQPGAVPPSRQRAADLLMRYGQRVLDLRAREADDQAILDYMARTEGPGFSSELSALVRHPKVIEMIELNRPAWLAIAADEVANALDMYLVVTQIRLTRKLSALSTFTGPLYDEFTKIIDARSASTTALLDANPDAPQLSRFDDLLMRWEEARMKVRDPNAEPPYRAFEGVARDLELMCVRSR